MTRWSVSSLAILFALCNVVLAQPTVTLTLDSPQDGLLVPFGAAVDWSIIASASTGDNEGLALVSCDLTQDPGNAGLFDIPPADGVPGGMTKFSRPAGVSNPGELDPNTGYTGVQRGDAGQMNLRQIGGGQNTFGEALPPGTGIGEDADCIAGVGQSGAQLVVSGWFVAPDTCGSYTFQLGNAQANVLTEHHSPPDFSPVTSATVDTSAGTFGFTVTIPGDLDGDFAVGLADLAQLLGNYGTLNGMTYADGDLNGDGAVDLADLAELLGNYGSSCG